MSIVNCDICGANDYHQLIQSCDRLHHISEEKFWVVCCNQCGLIFTCPRPEENELTKYYPTESYYAYNVNLKHASRLDNLREQALHVFLEHSLGYPQLTVQKISRVKRQLLAFLFKTRYRGYPNYVPGAKVLDVGCGAGDFLSMMQSFGFDAYGVEVNSIAVERAKQRGLNVALGSLETHSFSAKFFDCVRFNQVLEHLPSHR